VNNHQCVICKESLHPVFHVTLDEVYNCCTECFFPLLPDNPDYSGKSPQQIKEIKSQRAFAIIELVESIKKQYVEETQK
jgi:hypothetical protein